MIENLNEFCNVLIVKWLCLLSMSLSCFELDFRKFSHPNCISLMSWILNRKIES